MKLITLLLTYALVLAAACPMLTVIIISPAPPPLVITPGVTLEDPTPTREGTQTPTATNETNTKAYGRVTATDGLNLRAVAVSGTVRAVLPFNTLVEIDNSISSASASGWFYVSVLTGQYAGESGWVSPIHILKGESSLE